jgi:selenocysteine lyase/cysteine desulfurase
MLTSTRGPAEPLLRMAGGVQTVPLVGGGHARAVNLDLAASAPPLQSVADHVAEVSPYLSSVHRGAGWGSEVCTAAYERGRAVTAQFVGARATDSVVFVRNTTDALNLLASIVPGETVTLDLEHHANLLPWLRHGSTVVRARTSIEETLVDLEAALASRPFALLAVTGASNVTGDVLPLRRLADLAHRHGARLAVDGAQLVPHRRVDLAETGIDYLAFSGHKIYAPYGTGVLVGRPDWLDAGEAYLAGGGAVDRVRLEGDTAPAASVAWRTGPARHEAGTPNVIGVVALTRALEELAALDTEAWVQHERSLREQLVRGLAAIDGVVVPTLFEDATDAVGVVPFAVTGVDARLVALALSAEWGVAVRDGAFCAHPLVDRIAEGRPLLRASIGAGSTAEDVDTILAALAAIVDQGPTGQYAKDATGWHLLNDDRPRPEWARDVPSGAGGCGFSL